MTIIEHCSQCLARLACAAASRCAERAGACASKGLDEPFRARSSKALQGKTVAFVPVAMGFDLAQGWLAGLKKELEPLRREDRGARSELEHQRRRAGAHDADRAKSRT